MYDEPCGLLASRQPKHEEGHGFDWSHGLFSLDEDLAAIHDVQSFFRGLLAEFATIQREPRISLICDIREIRCRKNPRHVILVAEVEVEGTNTQLATALFGVSIGCAAGQAILQLEVGAEGVHLEVRDRRPVERVGGAEVEVVLRRAALEDALGREGAAEVHVIGLLVGDATLDGDAREHEVALRQMLARRVPFDDVGLAGLDCRHGSLVGECQRQRAAAEVRLAQHPHVHAVAIEGRTLKHNVEG